MSKAENTRRRIIEKAAPIFNTKGIAATSISDVLESAKIARGGLYGHFETKEDLACATVDYLLQKAAEETDKAMAKPVTAVGKILAFLESNKDPLNPSLAGGCPIMNLSTEVDDTNLMIKKKVRSSIEAHIKLFTQILSDGIISGELSPRLVPGEFAAKMFCAVKGAAVMCNIMNSKAYMRTVIHDLVEDLKSYQKPQTIKNHIQ